MLYCAYDRKEEELIIQISAVSFTHWKHLLQKVFKDKNPSLCVAQYLDSNSFLSFLQHKATFLFIIRYLKQIKTKKTINE